MQKLKTILVDIDGTLANVQHRRPFLDKEEPDWQSFNESCIVDEPNEWCLDLIDGMFDAGFMVVLLSARTEQYRFATETWLEAHGVKYHNLLMRTVGDFRSDEVVKEEIYNKEIKNQYSVSFVVDDRQKVVDMWRRIGVTCLQCDKWEEIEYDK